jgi:GR25 family glycosyltransferase involved in LPS biosynthesis
MTFQLKNIPIFCINRGDRKDRWERMEKRFKEYNLKVTRWEASTPEDVEKCGFPFAQYLSPFQRACSLSHLRIYQYMLDNNIESVFILEDDASFRKDWKSIVEKRLENIDNLDSEWDALFLNVTEELKRVNTWLPCIDQCLTGGYIIRKQAAEWILDIPKRNGYYFAADWMTQLLQKRCHSYTYFPWLIIQEDSKSDIKKETRNLDYEKVLRLLDKAKYSIENYDI